MRAAVVACGALAGHIDDIAERNGLNLHVEAVDPLLHNRPERIAAEVEQRVVQLRHHYDRVAVAYADCGTYGALDEVCIRVGVRRLSGRHCYDVFATEQRMVQEFAAVPGTFVLTDFLARTFQRNVVQELGLDQHPELRDDYFHSYTRMLWLTQAETPELATAAQAAADALRLPLEVARVGDVHLERQLLDLLGAQA
jgi:hypothetical protein